MNNPEPMRIFGLTAFELLSFVLVLSTTLLLCTQYSSPRFHPESSGFLNFADQIINGAAHKPPEVGHPPAFRAYRTPFYPLLLASGKTLIGGPGGYVLGVHTIFCMLVIAITTLCLRPKVPIVVSGSVLLFVLFETCAPVQNEFFSQVLTEWSAACLLIMYFALIVLFFKDETPTHFLFVTLCGAALILTRPTFIVLLPSLLAVYFYSHRKIFNALFGLVGLSPIIFWMAINLQVLGSFSITSYAGVNIFGVAALIGHADPLPGDSEELKDFITRANTLKTPAIGEEAEFLRNKMRHAIDPGYNHNIYEVVMADETFKSYHPTALNRMMHKYAVRTFLKFPDRLMKYIWVNLKRSKGKSVLILAGFFLSLACFRAGMQGFAIATLSLTSIHLLNILLSATIHVIVGRYVLVTLGPLYAAIALSAAALAWHTHPFQRTPQLLE